MQATKHLYVYAWEWVIVLCQKKKKKREPCRFVWRANASKKMFTRKKKATITWKLRTWKILNCDDDQAQCSNIQTHTCIQQHHFHAIAPKPSKPKENWKKKKKERNIFRVWLKISNSSKLLFIRRTLIELDVLSQLCPNRSRSWQTMWSYCVRKKKLFFFFFLEERKESKKINKKEI